MNNNFEIIRKTEKGYTRQPNAILRDEGLTSDAKVIIYFLLSLTKSKKGYHLTTQSIISTVHISKSRVEKAIELLQKTGIYPLKKSKMGADMAATSGLFQTFREFFVTLFSRVRKTESSETQSTEIP